MLLPDKRNNLALAAARTRAFGRVVGRLDRGQREVFEERAGVLEFYHCQPREVAEGIALAEACEGWPVPSLGRLGSEVAGRVRVHEDRFAALGWPGPVALLVAVELIEGEALTAAAKWFRAREQALDDGQQPPEYPAWVDWVFPSWAVHAEEDGISASLVAGSKSLGGREDFEVGEAFALEALRPDHSPTRTRQGARPEPPQRKKRGSGQEAGANASKGKSEASALAIMAAATGPDNRTAEGSATA